MNPKRYPAIDVFGVDSYEYTRHLEEKSYTPSAEHTHALRLADRQIGAEYDKFVDKRTIHTTTFSVEDVALFQNCLSGVGLQGIRRLQIIITVGSNPSRENKALYAMGEIVELVTTLTNLIELQTIWTYRYNDLGVNEREVVYQCGHVLRKKGPISMSRYRIVPYIGGVSDHQSSEKVPHTFVPEKRANGAWLPSGKWDWE